MTEVFICRKCCGTLYNVCAYLNSSTAFPANILEDLKCPQGHEPNWEHAEKVFLHIPVNFVSTLTQDKLRKEKKT